MQAGTNIIKVIIVGGGTAGWLTAGLLAAQRHPGGQPCFQVTVLEPPDIPVIGVGEGTWPTMRATLKAIGANERDFMRACRASFKQGSKFRNWAKNEGEFYYHPFERPAHVDGVSGAELWAASGTDESFSLFTNRQEYLCERHLAPKLISSADYAGVTNYGYHFDAVGMSKFLRRHCEDRLGVTTISDRMTHVRANANGLVVAIETEHKGALEGDFFVDCTGFRSLLLKGHYKVATVPLNDVLFADRAITAHLPYRGDAPIQSTTIGSAQSAGWIWDVGLSDRRGIGYVHSSAHTGAEQAIDVIQGYIKESAHDPADIALREIKFSSGYLETFWVGNCAAIGLSAGFVEPLEASSIMLTEIGARHLCELLKDRSLSLNDGATAFSTKMTAHWQEVVDFLKLHYVLSKRPEPFWRDNRRAGSIPESLKSDLEMWERGEQLTGASGTCDRLFPHESLQYVWFGMHGRAALNASKADASNQIAAADRYISDYDRQREHLADALPTNRALVDLILNEDRV